VWRGKRPTRKEEWSLGGTVNDLLKLNGVGVEFTLDELQVDDKAMMDISLEPVAMTAQ
jgi:hypothetical protein